MFKNVPLRTVAVGALLLTAAACLFPWASSESLVRVGVQTGDGRILGLVALAGIGLVLREKSFAWMAPGFCVAIAIRAMNIIDNNPDFEVRFGVLMAMFMAGLAAVVLISDYLIRARSYVAVDDV